MTYTIDQHRHRFAAWAASRAASVIGCRFSVQQGLAMLEQAGFNATLQHPDELPTPDLTDAAHREWRRGVIAAGTTLSLNLTHGVAAKLINVYLKAGLVCAGHERHERVSALHPPIDSLLLDALVTANFGGLLREWKIAKSTRWSKLDSDQYESLISHLRTAMNSQPLWMIEAHWRGYQ